MPMKRGMKLGGAALLCLAGFALCTDQAGKTPGALTRDEITRLNTAEPDPQAKPGAPAAVDDRYFDSDDVTEAGFPLDEQAGEESFSDVPAGTADEDQVWFLNHSDFGQNFEVAINGSETNSRQTFSNYFINLAGRRVRKDFSQLLQNDTTLSGHTQWMFGHRPGLLLIIITIPNR